MSQAMYKAIERLGKSKECGMVRNLPCSNLSGKEVTDIRLGNHAYLEKDSGVVSISSPEKLSYSDFDTIDLNQQGNDKDIFKPYDRSNYKSEAETINNSKGYSSLRSTEFRSSDMSYNYHEAFNLYFCDSLFFDEHSDGISKLRQYRNSATPAQLAWILSFYEGAERIEDVIEARSCNIAYNFSNPYTLWKSEYELAGSGDLVAAVKDLTKNENNSTLVSSVSFNGSGISVESSNIEIPSITSLAGFVEIEFQSGSDFGAPTTDGFIGVCSKGSFANNSLSLFFGFKLIEDNVFPSFGFFKGNVPVAIITANTALKPSEKYKLRFASKNGSFSISLDGIELDLQIATTKGYENYIGKWFKEVNYNKCRLACIVPNLGKFKGTIFKFKAKGE